MPVTIDLPPHILEAVRKKAAAEGVSLDKWIARLLESAAKETIATMPLQTQARELPIEELSNETASPFGRFRGTVLYIADDFDEPLDDFQEYMK
jgi:hypothetical protein